MSVPWISKSISERLYARIRKQNQKEEQKPTETYTNFMKHIQYEQKNSKTKKKHNSHTTMCHKPFPKKSDTKIHTFELGFDG